jgi:Fur family zinc uptake transcriptional regulator
MTARPANAPHTVAQAIAHAERLAVDRRFRLTPLRRRVLELLAASPSALGAYDLLPHLKREGLGGQPIVAYRALDFLLAQGLAHRIEGMNAFVACTAPATAHYPSFLVCRVCRRVREDGSPIVDPEIEATAASHGFMIERQVVEVLGLCAACAADATGTDP